MLARREEIRHYGGFHSSSSGQMSDAPPAFMIEYICWHDLHMYGDVVEQLGVKERERAGIRGSSSGASDTKQLKINPFLSPLILNTEAKREIN